MDDNGQPWDRMRDGNGKLEPARWFARFEIFRHLGPERAIEETFRRWREKQRQSGAKMGKKERPSELWYTRAKEWRWKARAEAWDLHVARVANQEMEEEHVRRRKEMVEWEWDAFRQLRERIEQMLRYPLARVTRPDPDVEGGVTVVEPVKWSQRDIVAFAKVASELGRLSVGMATAHSELDIHLAAKEFLDALPPGIRETVRGYLAEALQRGGAEGGS